MRAHYHIAAVYRHNLPHVTSQSRWLVDPLAPESPLPENQNGVYAVQAELRNEADLHRVVEVTLARFGRIDLLVNAAVHSIWAPMLDGDALHRSFHEQLDVNVFVPLRLSALVAEKFWKHREVENRYANRCVVNISSTAGLYVYPGSGQSVYSASKAALNYLTLHMSQEFGPIGVRVNALAPDGFPGIIPTEMAADGVRRLSESDANGRILVMDGNGERWL